MKQMKKLLASLLASALLLTGCTGGTSSEGSSTASGEESSTVSQAERFFNSSISRREITPSSDSPPRKSLAITFTPSWKKERE